VKGAAVELLMMVVVVARWAGGAELAYASIVFSGVFCSRMLRGMKFFGVVLQNVSRLTGD
jgi:hypothetical protein